MNRNLQKLPENELRLLLGLNQIESCKSTKCLNIFQEHRSLLPLFERNGFYQEKIKKIDWNQTDRELLWQEEANHEIFTIFDEDFPELLRQIPNPPKLLFCQGQKNLFNRPTIAIVGSRNPSQSGLDIAYQVGKELSEIGFGIISGLAVGIDSSAHRGALEGGSTSAVFGSGLEIIYPSCNRALAREIETRGTLLSEFPVSRSPTKRSFIQRNRIISGLALGTIIVEASLKSGSLSTARFALEQGRELFAVPGAIKNPLARGCHLLLKEGAHLFEESYDIVRVLESQLSNFKDFFSPSKRQEISKSADNHLKLTQKEKMILDLIGFEAVSLDFISQRSSIPFSEIAIILAELKKYSLISERAGQYERICK